MTEESRTERVPIGVPTLLILAAFILAGCSAYAWWNRTQARVERLVRPMLIDPASAVIELSPGSSPEQGVICGTVNGRNRLGAYTGATPFIVVTPREDDLSWRVRLPSSVLGQEPAQISACCMSLRAAGLRDEVSDVLLESIRLSCDVLSPPVLHRWSPGPAQGG